MKSDEVGACFWLPNGRSLETRRTEIYRPSDYQSEVVDDGLEEQEPGRQSYFDLLVLPDI